MNLTHDAMLVSLRINSWSGRLYDRQASQQVAVHNDADSSAGRYNKRLLPKQAFAALAATMSNARTGHNANTLPWDDQGGRLLTVANYERYTAALDSLIERVVRERARFIEDYDDYVDQARLDLGRLFRLEDYPGTEALQGKFAIRYRIVPVPDARHFMADLAQGETERVRRDIEQPSPDPSQRCPARSLQAPGRGGRACRRTLARGRERQTAGVPGQPDREHQGAGGRRAPAQHLRRRRSGHAVPGGEGQVRRYRAGRPAPVGALRSQSPPAGQARRRCAHGPIRGLLRARRCGRAHPKQGGSLMAAHARSESARRVSDCVTALLRDQPFFGSLALRLPIRADATRETLASDGKDIRYAPQWVADTDADHIKTALARVVLACALKHHTRRGGRDPERWQRASQLVTHGLLRDAGFVHCRPSAEAWDGFSAEQAYDRLPEPSDDAVRTRIAPRVRPGTRDGNGGARTTRKLSDVGDDQNAPSDPTDDGSPQEQDEPGSGSNNSGSKPSGQMPASHDPCGTGEVMDADERRDDATGQSGESPVDTPAEEQAWDEAMHQAASLAPGARQRAGRRRGDDPASTPEHPRLAVTLAPLHDRCRAPRL